MTTVSIAIAVPIMAVTNIPNGYYYAPMHIGVTFTFVPQSSFTVLERDTIDSLEIQKSGATTLTFRVTLRVELITNSGSSSMYETIKFNYYNKCTK